MPIAQSRVTAIAFHAAGPGALALKPLGRQANQGLHRASSTGSSAAAAAGCATTCSGGDGVRTGALDVGATTGTDVYSPVDGTVVGIAPNVLNGKRYGVRASTCSRSGSPSVVVSLTHLRADPSLAVGDAGDRVRRRSSGACSTSRGVERQALAHYTPDAGNHVAIQVHPAASLSVP